MKDNEVLFFDLNINFKAHPVTGNLYTVSNVAAIKQAIKNLVLTNKYEVLFNPDCYSNVTYSLFENIDSADLVFLKNNITNVIRNYDSRAEIISIRTKDDMQNNTFAVEIVFLPTNSVTIETVDIFLERLR